MALRKAAKKQEGFKDFIRKLDINGLTVQKNNKFKLTSRYIYAFIRDFTDFEENRSGGKQTFTITAIGPFGYDYNIRAIKTSSTGKRPRSHEINVTTPEVDVVPL